MDFSVREFDYSKRDGLLTSEALSEPKSKKDFPYYIIDGKKFIYKPLSKTKPLTTPLFSYSEVVWSTLLNKFFDSKIPIYHLAKCNGLSEEVLKRYNIGTYVESIVSDDVSLVSIYEYFLKNKDAAVESIMDYVNYCMMYYDYRMFFDTKLVKENKYIGEEIARNLLYAILRADQNYHYENIGFIMDGDKILSVAPPIDHEFSTMFLYPDNEAAHLRYYGEYINSLLDEYYGNELTKLLLSNEPQLNQDRFKSTNYLNIVRICELYPDIVRDFIKSLKEMILYLVDNPIVLEDHDYLIPCSSDAYREGIIRYKENKVEEADEFHSLLEFHDINIEETSNNINNEILESSNVLLRTLENRLSML